MTTLRFVMGASLSVIGIVYHNEGYAVERSACDWKSVKTYMAQGISLRADYGAVPNCRVQMQARYRKFAYGRQTHLSRTDEQSSADGATPLAWSAVNEAGAILAANSTKVPSGSSAQVVYAPQVPQPSQAGDVVGLNLQNTSASTEAAGYVTFGEIFKIGAVQPTDALAARINRVNGPVQMDVKAKHTDGSVRHAILTFLAPAIGANASVGVMLAKGSASLPVRQAPSPSALVSSGYNVSTTLNFTSPNSTSATVNGQTTLQQANNPQMWLSGPLVNEWRVTTTVNSSLLKVTFDIRAYADGSTHTDLIYDNGWFQAPGKGSLTYNVTISQNGSKVFSYSNLNQYLFSKWHKEVNSASIVQPNAQYDVPYLEATGAIQNYDLSLGASYSQIQANYNNQDYNNPMSTSIVTVGMGATGGRQDIAPQPNWTAEWIVSQNTHAKTAMMGAADAGGNVPWHWIDENTGKPVNIETYPDFSGAPTGGPWVLDNAHVPELNYVPYLITGSHYQLDLMQAEGDEMMWGIFGYSHAFENCDPPSGAPLGVFAFWTQANCGSNSNQHRAAAWELRSLSDTAYATPDNDPLKSMFMTELGNAVNGAVQVYVNDNFEGKFGQVSGMVGNIFPGNEHYSAWQEGYIETSFGQIAAMNLGTISTQAVQMLRYMENYVQGLATNSKNGMNPLDGIGDYYHNAVDPNTGTPYDTWEKVLNNNMSYNRFSVQPGFSPNPAEFINADTQGYGGYPNIYLAGTANVVSFVGDTRSRQAYQFVKWKLADDYAMNGINETQDLQNFPQFNIVPRPGSPSTNDQVVDVLWAQTPAGVPMTGNAAALSGVINAGDQIALHWSSLNATSCTGTNFSTDNRTSGTLTVRPSASTSYSITCTGPSGTFSYGPVLITLRGTQPKPGEPRRSRLP